MFDRQCEALLTHIPEIVEVEYLIDVDGSEIRKYQAFKTKEVAVFNSKEFGVYIQSNFDIATYF